MACKASRVVGTALKLLYEEACLGHADAKPGERDWKTGKGKRHLGQRFSMWLMGNSYKELERH